MATADAGAHLFAVEFVRGEGQHFVDSTWITKSYKTEAPAKEKNNIWLQKMPFVTMKLKNILRNN